MMRSTIRSMKSLAQFIAPLLLLSPVSLAATPDTVTFQSSNIALHGLLYKPVGTGPFPAVLYNHGSAPGMLSNEAFEAIAPLYISRGWVFFASYRRGQGLSASAGPYILEVRLHLVPLPCCRSFNAKGIGSKLIRDGLAMCRQAGYDVVVVLGAPAYYSRFGFMRAADFGLHNEYGVHDEFMVLPLREGALEGVSGLVKYLPEFREDEC